jgi:hypothetical protein
MDHTEYDATDRKPVPSVEPMTALSWEAFDAFF